MNTETQVIEAIRDRGFTLVQAAEMRPLLEQFGSVDGLEAFAESWNDLGADTFMADGGRYRKRRYGLWEVTDKGFYRQEHQPHYQSRDYNLLNGGIQRWFDPIADAIGSGNVMTTVLGFCRGLFGSMTPAKAWHVEVHQFRIEARHGAAGQPTPEGMHRDGHNYVLVLMVKRTNIRSGVTSVHDLKGQCLGEFTLTDPLDAAIVDDIRVMHGVTPVEPLDPERPGYRDVLVVTFRVK